jgi:hypothetical protein
MNNKRSPYEKELASRKKQEMQEEYIKERALKEWPTIKHFNQALRYLEVFAQIMRIKPFLAWMKEHIEIHDQINHKEKTIDTVVMYKEKDKEPVKALDIPEENNQNLMRCPGCGVLFDANVKVPVIQLATEIPRDLKPEPK